MKSGAAEGWSLSILWVGSGVSDLYVVVGLAG